MGSSFKTFPKNARPLVLGLTFLLTACAGSEEMKTVKGIFLGLERGDYVIKNETGEDSFFMNLKSPSVKKVEENPDRYVGNKCIAKYIETKQNFPEGGGEFEIKLLEEVIWEKK